MLITVIKLLAFVAIVAGITYGAMLVMELPGQMIVEIGTREFSLGPLQMAIAFVVLVAAVWLFFQLLGLSVAFFRFLNGDETAISRYFMRNRERRGFQALADGLMALASGEGKLALAKAQRAEKYLERPELTNLLTAQAAEAAGDRATAERTYRALLQDDRTRFVGIRGLMRQKLDAGDTDTALKLAEKAFAIKPGHEETQDTLLRLQARDEDWRGARKTLQAKVRSGSLPRDVHRRRDAVLALSEARRQEAEDVAAARKSAIEANKLSPELAPAAAMAARGYIAEGNPRYATRVLKTAWQALPHPDLAAAFAEIAPDEAPDARIKRFSALTRLKPDHPETRMLLAELNIAAEQFPEARRALGDLATSDPTARSLTIMAAIERGEGADDSVVRGWLAKALVAPRGPQWQCQNCGHIHTEWRAVCSECESFDSLSWTTPKQSEIAMPRGAEMLPLIVGKAKTEQEPEPGEADLVEAVAEVVEETPETAEDAKN